MMAALPNADIPTLPSYFAARSDALFVAGRNPHLKRNPLFAGHFFSFCGWFR